MRWFFPRARPSWQVWMGSIEPTFCPERITLQPNRWQWNAPCFHTLLHREQEASCATATTRPQEEKRFRCAKTVGVSSASSTEQEIEIGAACAGAFIWSGARNLTKPCDASLWEVQELKKNKRNKNPFVSSHGSFQKIVDACHYLGSNYITYFYINQDYIFTKKYY